MTKLILAVLLVIPSIALAADPPPQVRFALSAHEGDDTTPVLINAAVPPGTTHRLQATEHLTFEISVAPIKNGTVDTWVRLIDDASGKAVRLANTEWYNPPTVERSFAYTVCPQDRVIFLRPIPTSTPRCADLPPMAKPDPLVGACEECLGLGPYEAMPTTLTAVSRIAPVGEPGEPLVITGRVFGTDGRPRRGIIVYAYHTNQHGIYPAPNPPRSQESEFHGRLRGWALTDAKGRYTFNTIRPASYPDTTITQHVHMHIIEPGCATYWIDEMLFTDDPFFKQRSPEDIARENTGRGGSGITTPKRDTSGTWHVTRDIYLGKNIPGYTACPQSQ